MSTKEGDRQLTSPHVLRSDGGDSHTIFTKGAHLGSVELRYYNGIDQVQAPRQMHSHHGFGARSSRGGFGDRSRNGGSRRSFDFGIGDLFSGSGARLGGTNLSMEAALARLDGYVDLVNSIEDNHMDANCSTQVALVAEADDADFDAALRAS